MGIETDVYRTLTYAGVGCTHRLLLRATRPSYPNADAGAEDAAIAFADGALAQLQAWFERWRLTSICDAEHAVTAVEESEEHPPVEGPGFRWVGDDATPAYFLVDTGRDGDLRDG